MLEKFQNNRTVVSGGVQTAIYLMLSVIVVLFFALGSLNDGTEFRSTIIFMTVLMASYMLLLGLATSPSIGKYFKGKNAQLFFQHDITIGHLIWVPIGFTMSFVFSLFVNNMGLQSTEQAMIAIIGSGAIMMFIFFRTGSILIPILIHGLFNTVILILTSDIIPFQVLSNTPIPVPEIGVTLGTLQPLLSESVFQFFLTAPSEEMFKMLVIAFVLAVTKNQFDNKSPVVYFAGAFSVTIWAFYHLIASL